MALRAYIGTARDVKFDDRVTEHTIPSNEVSGNTLDKYFLRNWLQFILLICYFLSKCWIFTKPLLEVSALALKCQNYSVYFDHVSFCVDLLI